jgi:hypothetical protein
MTSEGFEQVWDKLGIREGSFAEASGRVRVRLTDKGCNRKESRVSGKGSWDRAKLWGVGKPSNGVMGE